MSEFKNHPHGMPLTIMNFSDSGEIFVDTEKVERIFNHPEIQDRKVVILSMIGASRGGKSYFLNYCLRFLYAHYSSINDPKINDGEFLFEKSLNWMGNDDAPLRGFSWRSGVKRDTIGIIMWSDVFLHTIETSGEKIAIFVMDTQGLFDKYSSQTDNSRIFVLSNMISSIQLLNLSNRIKEDQLQYLQLTIEFALYSLDDKKEFDGKSFQNLLFLIRDWNNGDDYHYGIDGGRAYLEEILTIKPNQKSELQSVRESISSCFDNIACCLLPDPGKYVACGNGYNGDISKMDKEFREELQKIIEDLLIPKNLIIKKFHSMDVNVREMKQYLLKYLKLFQSNQIPEVSSIYELTVENLMTNLIEKCFDDYKMTVFRNEDIITEENMCIVHEKCKERSLEYFDSEKKLGNSKHVEKFRIMLREEIESFFTDFKDHKVENLSRINEARAKYNEYIQKNPRKKEEIIKNIDSLKNQLDELLKKRNESGLLTEFYDNQESILKTRLVHDEKELENIEKKEQMENVFRMLLLVAATATVPVSATSLAGLAGATEFSALTVLGAAADAYNIAAYTSLIFTKAKNWFSWNKNNDQNDDH